MRRLTVRNVKITFVYVVYFSFGGERKVAKESRAAYENVTFSNGGDRGRTSMCGLKQYR